MLLTSLQLRAAFRRSVKDTSGEAQLCFPGENENMQQRAHWAENLNDAQVPIFLSGRFLAIDRRISAELKEQIENVNYARGVA